MGAQLMPIWKFRWELDPPSALSLPRTLVGLVAPATFCTTRQATVKPGTVGKVRFLWTS